MAKILITGGSGFLGRKISEYLLFNQHQVAWLSRENGTENGITKYKWDIEKNYIDEAALEKIDGIIHLAGAGIVDKRWSEKRKEKIIYSRVKSSSLLHECILKTKCPVKTIVGASAIGYYGSQNSEEIFMEDSLPGSDFLSETCIKWENSYTPFKNSGIRTSIIRIGIVLGKNGGAYAKLYKPFKFGFGTALSSGNQYFPWIHLNDVSSIFIHALFNQKVEGIFNAVGSEIVTNLEFSNQLAASFNSKIRLPNVPELFLRLALGESAITVTSGLRVSNQKIKATGFKFEFEKLSDALKDLSDYKIV